MGLRERLAGRAVSGAHVLLAETPGSWRARVAVEQAVIRRGWRTAVSPADADVLAVCGQLSQRFTGAVDRIWAQMPGPRARVDVLQPDRADPALDAARDWLLDDDRQREDARSRPTVPVQAGQMDHGQMDMAGPGGLALASGGPDRDGLAMDVLHVPLGPILPHWPSGLVLRCALQGDVITAADAELIDPPETPRPGLSSPTGAAALRCDAVADLLALAGWDALATKARRVRDRLVDGPGPDPADSAVVEIGTRMTRSRTLRWALQGLGTVGDDLLIAYRLADEARGDVYDRLLRLVASAGDLLGERPAVLAERSDRSTLIGVLPALVVGLDIAAARLVVASLAPLPTQELAVQPGTGHA